MFESLSDRLSSAFRSLSGRAQLTEENIRDGLREVRLALLEADVNFKVVKQFVARTKERCLMRGARLPVPDAKRRQDRHRRAHRAARPHR